MRKAVLIGSRLRVFSLVAWLPGAALGQAFGITDMGVPPGPAPVFRSEANAITADGGMVAGVAFYIIPSISIGTRQPVAFRWTAAGGWVQLGGMPGYGGSSVGGMSDDGSVVAGTAIASLSLSQAYRWTEAGGMMGLGFLNGGSSSFGLDVNSDGSVVVGEARDGVAANQSRAFRWTAAGGMVNLGVLNGGTFSSAAGVNSDGSVVVGSARDGAAGNEFRAFRWTASGGMVSLGVLSGGTSSEARAVNADGTVVVGRANDASGPSAFRAFRWTQPGGIVALATVTSVANAVTPDGNVVVGSANLGAGGASRAFRWTPTTGMQSVEDWLRSTGISVPQDITLSAEDVSADGNVVVGQLRGEPDNRAFIARSGSGILSVPDFLDSLSINAVSFGQVVSLGQLVLSGAHSRPLARRMPAGKSCAWTAGDIGRDDHGSRDGRIGLAEIGACHALTDGLQGAVAVGRSWSEHSTTLDGSSEVDGTYGIAEVLTNVPGSELWISAALLYMSGELDARRGYFNAGATDHSAGRAPIHSTAVRVRVDWLDAARVAAMALTPYADLTFARVRLGGYTESGGGFPASFDARKDASTEARLGIDALRPVSSTTSLIGKAEAVHRNDASTGAATGSVPGAFAFNLPDAQTKRDWLRLGVGFESLLGRSKLSAMLNATTQGAAPSYWLNLTWQVAL